MTRTQTDGSKSVVTLDDEFQSLLGKELNRSGKELEPVQEAVAALFQNALASVEGVSQTLLDQIAFHISECDKKLSAGVNEILHHPDFQALESTWRGLQHLAANTQWSADLQLRVLDIQKDELIPPTGSSAKFDQSPLFKKIYDKEYGTYGGQPYGAFVADFYFDSSDADIRSMRNLALLGAAAHAPVVTGASPKMLGVNTWSEMLRIEDVAEKMALPELAAWQSLRRGADSKYLALTAPRFLGRAPYEPRTAGFDFYEDVKADGSGFVWANSAFAFASNVTRAFRESGWTSHIVGPKNGGNVSNLPIHVFRSDEGATSTQCPTEVAIPTRREKELADAGFISLLHRKNSAEATFFSATSIYKPKKDIDPEKTASERLSAQLNYMMPVSRFAHYLNSMVRDFIGSGLNKEQLTSKLTSWIKLYVHPNPSRASDQEKAKQPLQEAKVILEEHEDNPGVYEAQFILKPHFQLTEMNIGLTLVSKIPKKGK